MNIFTGIWHFFEEHFKHNSPFVQSVLGAVGPYFDKAMDIVEKVDDEVKVILPITDGSAIHVALEKVEPFLLTFEKDAVKVKDFVGTLTGHDAASELHNIAVFALGAVFPASSVAFKLLNLAVELAYNTFETKKAATPITAPVK